MKNSKSTNALQALKFGLFSVSAGIIQIASFYIIKLFVLSLPFVENLVNEHPSYQKLLLDDNFGICYLIALTLSVIWNFTVNRKFTFKSAANIPIAMLKVFGFYLVFTPVTTIIGQKLSTMYEDNAVLDAVVLLSIMASNMILEFLYCKFVVYRNNEFTADTKEKKKKK